MEKCRNYVQNEKDRGIIRVSDFDYNEEERRRRRALRIQQMKKEKERSILIWKCVKIAAPTLLLLVVAICIVANAVGRGKTENRAFAQSYKHDTALCDGKDALFFRETVPEVLLADGSPQAGTATNVAVQDANGAGAVQVADVAEGATEQNVSSPSVTNPGDNMAETGSGLAYSAEATEDTLYLGEDIVSTHALLIDLETDEILAMKDAYSTISPASMTKVLTILVAAEHITEAQLDDTFTMTLEITDYGFIHDCSNAGFLDGEVITVRDLFYGTILPSGADAAVGLAVYVAGSHEAFVEMMNDKLSELGLSDTAHVTNCVGIYDEEHYCTTYDMAVIMKAALENEICREVMTAHTYTTSFTEQHPEGILISNWFLRRIEDKDTGGEVICAKTGFVNQSGSCAVSYGIDNGGKEYICVTANATSSWKCIYDHVALYKKFATGEENTD